MKRKHSLLLGVILFIFLLKFISPLKKDTSDLSHISLEHWKSTASSTFHTQQLQFERVRNAYQAKETYIKRLLISHRIHSFQYDLFLRAFKKEEILEVWAKDKSATSFKLIKTFSFCKNSGTLGPKRKEGDLQIPEGFYQISHFNPKSNFLLSLKVNYPNASDKILSDPTQPGSDIYIHGSCHTTGCIPITDDKIQELYLLAVEAHEVGQQIPIHIFPTKNWSNILDEHAAHFSFWKNLKQGFDFFEKNGKLPKVEVLENGEYVFSKD